MYSQISFELKSACPLIMHSGKKLTNPLHPLTKEIKKFSGKKKKTDEDFYSMAKLEWLGGMYFMEEPSITIKGNEIVFIGGNQPCIPSDVLEGMLIKGGMKNKLGNEFKSGMYIDQDYPLIYNGITTPEEMFNNANFVDTRKVKIQSSSIMRTRPIFKDWTLEFTVNYLPNVVNKEQIVEALTIAGYLVGIGDYRPKYGRFLIVSHD